MTEHQNNQEKISAIALGYDIEEDMVPKILASGGAEIAKKIIAIAKEHNIPIHHDAQLTEILSALNVGDTIPIEAYMVISEILSYIYKLKKS